jgi:hypothetical protein
MKTLLGLLVLLASLGLAQTPVRAVGADNAVLLPPSAYDVTGLKPCATMIAGAQQALSAALKTRAGYSNWNCYAWQVWSLSYVLDSLALSLGVQGYTLAFERPVRGNVFQVWQGHRGTLGVVLSSDRDTVALVIGRVRP